MKLNIFILLLFSFFLISCEKEVKIDIPIQDRKLVAICYAGENDSLQLFFDETKTMPCQAIDLFTRCLEHCPNRS